MIPITPSAMFLTGSVITAVGLNSMAPVSDRMRTVGPSVAVRAHCEAMLPAYCQGHYGFEVQSDSWRVGPHPGGRVLSGRLPAAEARRLREAAEQVLHRAANQPPTCIAIGPIPGVRQQVTVTDGERTVTLKGTGGQLDPSCSIGGGTEYAALFAIVIKLMQRYYPRPF